MHTVTEADRQCARDLLAGFAHTQPPVDFMLEQVANHIAAHREASTSTLRSALIRATGSLGLVMKGASGEAPGHKQNYDHARTVLAETESELIDQPGN